MGHSPRFFTQWCWDKGQRTEPDGQLQSPKSATQPSVHLAGLGAVHAELGKVHRLYAATQAVEFGHLRGVKGVPNAQVAWATTKPNPRVSLSNPVDEPSPLSNVVDTSKLPCQNEV